VVTFNGNAFHEIFFGHVELVWLQQLAKTVDFQSLRFPPYLRGDWVVDSDLCQSRISGMVFIYQMEA
jgi:hypothetical protein